MEPEAFVKEFQTDKIKSPRLQPRRILVVEDDKDLADLIGQALHHIEAAAEIHRAVSLEQAVGQLISRADIKQKEPYDLIIADIMLEGAGTGLDLIKVINRIYPRIPFLVISSLGEDVVKSSLEAEKKDNLVYLRKPFQFVQCENQIKNILAGLG